MAQQEKQNQNIGAPEVVNENELLTSAGLMKFRAYFHETMAHYGEIVCGRPADAPEGSPASREYDRQQRLENFKNLNGQVWQNLVEMGDEELNSLAM